MLAPGGRVIFIVPNRSGLWARRDVTPFGFGRPYSLGQLESAARAATASPPSATPPRSTRRRRTASSWLQTAYFWERLGRRFEPRVIAGALLVEASKQVYARPPASGSRVAVPGPLDVLEGLAGPSPEPVRGHGRNALARRDARALIRERRFLALHPRIATLPTLCYQRADFAGDAGLTCGRITRFRPRGAGVRTTEGCRWPAQLH